MLVEREIIRIIDIAFIGKSEEGDVVAMELTELDPEVQEALESTGVEVQGLLNDEDLQKAAEELEPNNSAAVLVRLFLNSAATSERPLVCMCSLKSCARGPAPNTSRMPIAQMRRDTRASAIYSTSSPQSRKNERRGPN